MTSQNSVKALKGLFAVLAALLFTVMVVSGVLLYLELWEDSDGSDDSGVVDQATDALPSEPLAIGALGTIDNGIHQETGFKVG